MHGKAVVAALFALAAGASAQTPVDPSVQHSVLLVLATAIPSDVATHAIADPLAFASEIGSSIAAGNLPAWYKALPTDVRGLLPQLYPEATPTVVASMYATSAPGSAAVTASASIVSASSALTDVISASSTSPAVQSPTLSTATSTATSTGAASFPTAAVGASVGAALGFFGLIAL